MLLVEELRRNGLEIVFLNRAIGVSPEEDLLLQLQGMFAEYVRAKILERSRRGKRHAAQHGKVNVLGGAPYGYRYITKHAGGESAAYHNPYLLRYAERVGLGCILTQPPTYTDEVLGG